MERGVIVRTIIALLLIALLVGFINYGKGKITDAKTGEPIEGATVYVDGKYCFFDSCGPGPDFITKTDKRGEFQSIPFYSKPKVMLYKLTYILTPYHSGTYDIFKKNYVPLYSAKKDAFLTSYDNLEELFGEEGLKRKMGGELIGLRFNITSEFCPSEDENLEAYCSLVKKIELSFEDCVEVFLDKRECASAFMEINNNSTLCTYASRPDVCLRDFKRMQDPSYISPGIQS